MAEYRRRRDNKLYQNYGIGIVLFQINLFKKKLLCVTNYSCIKLACLFVDKRLQKKKKKKIFIYINKLTSPITSHNIILCLLIPG